MFRARLPSIQHMSQNARPATEFAPCRHLTQPCQCDLQKTRNTTRLKCCACHENCKTSSENVAKVLRLPHKTTFDTTRLNVTKCHACHAKRSNETSETSKNDHRCRNYHRHGHIAIARTVADGCERLRPWTQRLANAPSTPRPPEWNGNPCYAFGKTQNLRPQDFISHIPVLNSARTTLQVTPHIISLEYHACRNHTQPLISAKPSTMAQKKHRARIRPQLWAFNSINNLWMKTFAWV